MKQFGIKMKSTWSGKKTFKMHNKYNTQINMGSVPEIRNTFKMHNKCNTQ